MSIAVTYKTREASLRNIVELLTPLVKRDQEFIDLAVYIMKIVIPKRSSKDWNTIFGICPMCNEKVLHTSERSGTLAPDLEWKLARHLQSHTVEEMKAVIIERSLEQS